MNPAILIIDDSAPTEAEVMALLGIRRYTQLIRHRVRIGERLDAVAREVGFRDVWHLTDADDARHRLEDVVGCVAGQRFVIITTDIVASTEFLVHYLAKLGWLDGDHIISPSSNREGCVAALGLRATRDFLTSRRGVSERRDWLLKQMAELPPLAGDELASLRDLETFVSYLSGSFYVRAFNAMRATGGTLTKTSGDREKIRKEHDFYYLLPARLQRFFVQPFELEVAEDSASYTMSRLAVPDAAVLWIHDAMTPQAMGGLLDGVFAWLAERPRRRDPMAASESAEALYRGKVHSRIATLLDSEVGQRLNGLIANGTQAGSIQDLVARYEALLDAYWARHGKGDDVAVNHGDLCLSNILYDPRIHLVKFIDPRGATDESQLWSDPHYDLAKLSHSFLGNYDLVNHGLYTLTLGENLQLSLDLDHAPDAARAEQFIERVTRAGFDIERVRLYEASLFLSMLPLHSDDPRKLAAIVLVAIGILDELEGKRPDSLFQRVLATFRR